MADLGAGPEMDPLQPEELREQPRKGSGGEGKAEARGEGEGASANTADYGAGQEIEPLAQQPSLDSTPGASAAAAAAAGERLRDT